MPLTDTRIRAFIGELEEFIDAEQAANRRQLEKVWCLPLSERVRRGWAIDDLRVDRVEPGPTGEEQLLYLRCENDNSRFREGDCVKITHDEPLDDCTILAEGMVVSSEEGELVVAVRKCRLSPGSEDLVLDAGLIDLTGKYKRALGHLAASSLGRERVIPLLLGALEPNRDSVSVDRFLAEGFNERQAEAIGQCVGTDLCHLVQGPPGTGKTKVLARVVKELVERDRRISILVTGFTHRAIDNALAKIIEAGVELSRVYKISGKAPSLPIPYVHKIGELPIDVSDGPVVIGATPFVLSTRLANFEFDWVLVDEASQITLPLAAMAMLAGHRWLFFGDDKQLPPVVQSICPKEAIERSVFGKLKNFGYHTQLSVSYRLNDDLVAWPADRFYDGDLVSFSESACRRLRLSGVPVGFEAILGPEPSRVFVRCDRERCTTLAIEECEVIADIVSVLVETRYPLSKVGVVVPYRMQARGIKRELIRRQLPSKFTSELVADTVERMQGQEREIVIFSMATADLEFARLLADFLLSPERLNVAITRSERKLIVVANSAWLDTIPALLPEAGLFSDFFKCCSVVSKPTVAHG